MNRASAVATALAACACACASVGALALAQGGAAGAPVACAAAESWPAAIAAARRVASERPGRVAFAVVDGRGRLRRGARAREPYASASVVKAMLLVAYTSQPHVRGRALRRDERALLGPMVRRSDNRAATRVRDLVGNAALRAVARRAGMRDFATAPSWGGTVVTAADLARLFWRIDRLVPARHRAYARELLAAAAEQERWGIALAAPAGWRPLLKSGWRKLASGRLFNQAALLEGPDGARAALAVLTDRSPDYGDGRRSVLLVARELVRALEAQPTGVSSRGAPSPGGQSKCHHSPA